MCEYCNFSELFLKDIQKEILNDICDTNKVEFVEWPFDLHLSGMVYRYIKGN